MPEMQGTITLAQESRFQLTDDQGASHLFLLGPHASAEPSQLVPLARRQARVSVTYSTAPDAIAFVAQSILWEDTVTEAAS